MIWELGQSEETVVEPKQALLHLIFPLLCLNSMIDESGGSNGFFHFTIHNDPTTALSP